MGTVYRAEDEALQRYVALKVPHAGDTSDPERRRRFLREARAAASLAHPNVAMVYQVGEDGRSAFIAMELIEGVTLRERLKTGPLTSPVARELALQIAEGLAAAHAKGNRSSRPQAREHHDHDLRRREGARFRSRQGGRCSGQRQRRRDGRDGDADHARWRSAGYVGVHVSGASDRGDGRYAVGRLRVRDRALRDARGKTSVHGRDGRRAACGHHARHVPAPLDLHGRDRRDARERSLDAASRRCLPSASPTRARS